MPHATIHQMFSNYSMFFSQIIIIFFNIIAPESNVLNHFKTVKKLAGFFFVVLIFDYI